MALAKLVFPDRVIAHRGASAYAPENTLAAFHAAKNLGIRWIELDVMLTRDQELVVIHDETLDRTTNGRGDVSAHTLADIQTLDAGSWFSHDFARESVPTLRQALQLACQQNLAINIEIKAQLGCEIQAVRRVLAVLEECAISDSALLISSFSKSIMAAVKCYLPGANKAYLIHEWHVDWQKQVEELDCQYIHVNEAILSECSVSYFKAANLPLLCYTVDNPQRALTLFTWGVDAVFSNQPDKILKLR